MPAPTTLSSEDPTLLPDEHTVLPMEKPAALPEESTPVAVRLPTVPGRLRESSALQDITPPAKRPRRRQLVFFDKETQITQEALQQQIDNTLSWTRPLVVVSDPSKRSISAIQLLGNPCTNLPLELVSLWKQVAVVRAVTGSALQVGRRVTDSEEERESAKEAVVEREMEEELGSKEVPRELAESGLSQPDVSSYSLLLLESSDKDVSREISQSQTPESRESPVPKSGSKLMDIPEDRVAEEVPLADLSADLMDQVADLLEINEGVLFHSLLPPLALRRTVTHSFWTLLEMVTARKLIVHQAEAYGDILISPGPNYEGNMSL
ncbi:hypothetical protein UPYG_G00154070 [Umbra pygmaea]|uniref:Rad21/Rec8-like protein C-terminal eukaryotic domain-containing protein n=1 Tax=Umbra pygmaea TaxID=75934 RepID=A0ABD0WXQ2_UMBPY